MNEHPMKTFVLLSKVLFLAPLLPSPPSRQRFGTETFACWSCGAGRTAAGQSGWWPAGRGSSRLAASGWSRTAALCSPLWPKIVDIPTLLLSCVHRGLPCNQQMLVLGFFGWLGMLLDPNEHWVHQAARSLPCWERIWPSTSTACGHDLGHIPHPQGQNQASQEIALSLIWVQPHLQLSIFLDHSTVHRDPSFF